MKVWLTCVVVFLGLCTTIFVTACADDSGWDASYGGAKLKPGDSQYAGESPPGSGSVPYVHEGPF
jgi:hypothetical protein